jgi:cold shock CspA family protein
VRFLRRNVSYERAPDEPGQDLFVQHIGIADGVRELTEGSNVEFDTEASTRAVNVRVV